MTERMTFDNIEQVTRFIDKVNQGDYAMARRKWFQDVYADASSKLLVWLFNKNGELTDRVEELEKKLSLQEADETTDDVDEVVIEESAEDVLDVDPDSVVIEDAKDAMPTCLDNPEEDDRH